MIIRRGDERFCTEYWEVPVNSRVKVFNLESPSFRDLAPRHWVIGAQSFEKAWCSYLQQSNCPRIFIPVTLCYSAFSHG